MSASQSFSKETTTKSKSTEGKRKATNDPAGIPTLPPIKRGKLSKQPMYSDLLTQFKGTGKLWEDPDFPADTTSVFFSQTSIGYQNYKWKRPKDICISCDPEFFVDGVSRFDVQQGALGDCWFIAVVASLSLYEPIFNNVVPKGQDFKNNYIGAFHFRFWKFGKWVDVVVDDRLPTNEGKLVYMKSTEQNEFWSALLEKAYAKMCGKYESLQGGVQSQAMIDFTGGSCETIKLNEKERLIGLYGQMLKYAKQSTLMGGSISRDQKSSLYKCHAYSITDVQQVKLNDGTNVELVRVRNPWGDGNEWKEKWCDGSAEWDKISSEDKDRLCLKIADDGEFWMCFEDFVDNFTILEICHLSSESLSEDLTGRQTWEMSIENGSWTGNVNVGDSFDSNPQYLIEVVGDPDDGNDGNDGNMTTIIVGLMQKVKGDRNPDGTEKGPKLLEIGYKIYKVINTNCRLDKSFLQSSPPVFTSPFIREREVCCPIKLPVGHYVIIPSIGDDSNEETRFMLRIFSEKKIEQKKLS